MANDRFGKIKLLATDVDYVLTDGYNYYFDNGVKGKRFNTRDGVGIELIMLKGIKVGFITHGVSQCVIKKADELKISFCRVGINDKAETLDNMRSCYGLKLDEVAYVGDDIHDLGALKLAGIAICPIDAMPEVKEICDYIVPVKGGEGVIRELYERWIK